MHLSSSIKELFLRRNLHLRLRMIAFVLMLLWTLMPIILFPKHPGKFINCILFAAFILILSIPGMELFLGILTMLFSLALLITPYLNNTIDDFMSFYYVINVVLPVISGIIIIVAWKIKKNQTDS